MLGKELLGEIVKSQRDELARHDAGFKREALGGAAFTPEFATVITGIRRCGKSTLLLQMMKKAKNSCYFSFEDPRLAGFEIADFGRLEEALLDVYEEPGSYFFDEIQNIAGWERHVRTLLDRKKEVVVTGSNASLRSRELGTRLTGRHLDIELFPFSYSEYLGHLGMAAGRESLENYLKQGGFPEYLKEGRKDILQNLLSDVLARDIAVRHGIRSLKSLKEMALFLLSNAGKEFTYNSLGKSFGLGSINSAIAFVSYFEDSYLMFTLPRFDYSLKKQLVNPKKSYAIDTGFSSANTLSFSKDSGRMLENAIFLHLRRKHKEIFYFHEMGECDFLVKERGKIVLALQACHELTEENKEREINGLVEALKMVKLEEGAIITMGQEDEFSVEGKRIKVVAAWKWMTGK